MVLGFVLVFGRIAIAANTATQSVSAVLPGINELSATGSPTLTVAAPAAGDDLAAVTDSSSSTYQFTTNQNSRKITGQITTGGDMPTGLTLDVTLTTTGLASGSWSAVSNVVLDSTAKTLATGGKGRTGTVKAITYVLTPTLDADPATYNRTITLTLTST